MLEAIVAVAIVGVALVPVITFISQMVNGLARAGDSNARNLAEQSIIELLEPLNPIESPIGDDQIGDLLIHWESESIIAPKKEMYIGASLAGFNLGFYNVKVSIVRANVGPWFSFDMRKVGYHRIGAGQLQGAP